MKPSFYIIDDDPSIRRVLTKIIKKYELGHILGENDDGDKAIKDIEIMKPDIVLVDLLLPSVDGIDIVKYFKEINNNILFIMISEVTSKDMIGDAFNNGIEYFINKPINVIEVVSIIKKVTNNLKLKQAFKYINKNMFYDDNKPKYKDSTNLKENYNSRIKKIFSEIGILGKVGSEDLITAIEFIIENMKGNKVSNKYKITDIYKRIIIKRKSDKKPEITVKAVEQRIRRVIVAALENIANIGIEDYTNLTFEKYSVLLFDFSEVKREMDFIRGKSQYRGKIKIKKFISAIINEVKLSENLKK